MWPDFSGKAYTRDQFAERIAALKWSDWKPIGITLHNTAAPTLAQWVESGPAHDARIRNLQSYYEGMGWRGGPHWFISRNWLNEFSNPLRRGTHSPSFNAQYFGIEMVGDFSREPFNTGDGAMVRDNAVFAMAVLCRKFNWDPGKVIVLHKEDPRTNHDCPGKFVVKADVIARVRAEMARLAGKPAPSVPDKPDGPADPPPTWKPPDHPAFADGKARRFTNITATMFGGPGDEQGGAYGPIDWNKPGVALPLRFKGARPKVRVFGNGKVIVCDIVDVGPWNINDEYWSRPDGRPRAESQFKNKTPDFKGRIPTNDAGIDLTPGAARAVNLPGKGKVDWEFVGQQPVVIEQNKPPANVTRDVGIAGGIAGAFAAAAHWLGAHPFLTVGIAVLVVGVVWFAMRAKKST